MYVGVRLKALIIITGRVLYCPTPHSNEHHMRILWGMYIFMTNKSVVTLNCVNKTLIYLYFPILHSKEHHLHNYGFHFVSDVSDCDGSDQFALVTGNNTVKCLEVVTKDPDEGLTWWQAREACREQGWQLFAPSDLEEHKLIQAGIADSGVRALDEANYWVAIARHQWYWALPEDKDQGKII